MIIDRAIDGNVRFTMYDYLEAILEEAPPEFDGEDTTPATSDLFKVPEATPLSDEMADQFHRTVARFLYAEKRARPDIQVAVAFLCKRVSEPNVADWKN